MIGEAIKRFPEEARVAMPGASGSAPARLRDLIAHHYGRFGAEHLAQRIAGSQEERDDRAAGVTMGLKIRRPV